CNIAERARIHLLLIDCCIQKSDRTAKSLTKTCDKAGPQWRHCTGTPRFGVLTANAHLVRAFCSSVSTHIGNTTAARAARRRRNVDPSLIVWLCEDATDPAARCTSLCPAVPYNFASDCVTATLQASAAAAQGVWG